VSLNQIQSSKNQNPILKYRTIKKKIKKILRVLALRFLIMGKNPCPFSILFGIFVVEFFNFNFELEFKIPTPEPF